MAYLDPNQGVGVVDDVIGTWPPAAAPANGVSMPAALKWLDDAIQGANGVVTFPAAAAPANGISLAEVLRAIYNLTSPTVATGTADIDDSVQDESSAWFNLITIEPAANTPLRNVKVCIDLDKATTGFAAVESTATIKFRIARKIDGTNWRGAETGSGPLKISAAVAGDDADGEMVELEIGDVGPTEDVRIEALMSADATADMEFPYIVMYEAMAAPTITPVAAG